MLRKLGSIVCPQPDFVWREIHWPADMPPDTATAVLRQLGADHLIRPIAFEVDGRGELVVYRIGVPPQAVVRATRLLMALVPDSALTPADRNADLPDAWRVVVTSRRRPVQIDKPEEITRALLAAVTATSRGEQASSSGCLDGRRRRARFLRRSRPRTWIRAGGR